MLWIALICTFITVIHGDCGPPPKLPNGMLKPEFTNHETYPIGSKVQYICNPGHVRIPGVGNFVICLENSKWAPVFSEFCTRKSCASPGDIDNGYFEASDIYFGSKVTYYCNEGFRMVEKKNFIECLADGSWSNNVPECTAVICPPPDSILHGTYWPLKEEYTYQDSVSYSCDEPNKFLNSEASIYCTGNGTWSSPPPKCITVDCAYPHVPFSRKLSGFTGPYPLNSVVKFDCYKGYVMSGHGSVVCRINNKWEPPLPRCVRNFCIAPTMINGYISEGSPTDFADGIVRGYNVGQTVTLKCSLLHFTMKGSKQITCGSDLTWNPDVPICEKRLGCSSPNILNGRVILRNKKQYVAETDGYAFENGDTIQIMCDPGFRMHGASETSKCVLNWFSYIWTPELPVCKPETK